MMTGSNRPGPAGTPAPDGALPVSLGGETLLLHPGRVVLWPAARTLFAADVHLGKEAVFRERGIAVPEGATDTDLGRLAALATRHRCDRIIVLGDLFHALPSSAQRLVAAVDAWLDGLAGIRVQVVAGNHDRAGVQRRFARLGWLPEAAVLGPFVLCHEPPEPEDHAGFVLAGHLHPCWRLRIGGDRLRMPVFWSSGDCLVLPAFGSFTGGWNVAPGRRDRLWVVGPDAVVEVPVTGRRQR